MNPKNVKKWQSVISNKEQINDDNASAFVKVKHSEPLDLKPEISLSYGNAQLYIPVGIDVAWLGSLVRELNS